jgi:hypothetical protein
VPRRLFKRVKKRASTGAPLLKDLAACHKFRSRPFLKNQRTRGVAGLATFPTQLVAQKAAFNVP